MQDMLVIKIPQFHIPYKKSKVYGYRQDKEKRELKEVLSSATQGYCMYCYSRIVVDGKNYGQLEHAIEKNNSPKLVNCIPNIGIACSICNSSFKKKGELHRKLRPEILQKYHEKSKCSETLRKQCRVPCRALRELQKEYSVLDGAEILLQPMGIKSKSGNPLGIQYDILHMLFEPCDSTQGSLTEEERKFVSSHIKRFHLNDPDYRTKEIEKFVRLVIDNGGKVPLYEYNNLVVTLFAEQMEKKTDSERLKICEAIYPILVLAG